MPDIEKIMQSLTKEGSGLFSTSDLAVEAIRDLAKDEIKHQIRKRIEADPALKKEIKDAVALYIDAKAKETYATIRLAKAGAKVGLELIPKDMRGQVAKEFIQIFEEELEELFNKTL